MYNCKYGSGLLSIGDLIRSPKGTIIIYQIELGQSAKFQMMAQSYCTRTDAKINQELLYAHNVKGLSSHLIKITVIKPAKPVKLRGRKPKNRKPKGKKP